MERVCDRVAIVRRGRLVALEDVAGAAGPAEAERRDAPGRPAARRSTASPASPTSHVADGRLTCRLEGDVGPFLAAIAGAPIRDLTIEPARLEEAFLEFYETEDSAGRDAGDRRCRREPARCSATPGEPTACRLLIVAIALLLWGTSCPIIYDAFGSQFQDIFESGAIPQQLAQFGGGDIFSLAGAVALGFVHPIAVGLNLVFAVGFAADAVAGERQRGTLEVLLARPLSRRAALRARWRSRPPLFVAVTVGGADARVRCIGAAVDGPDRRARRRQPAAPLAQRRAAVLGVRGDRAAGLRRRSTA